ncbi:MAG: NAD-dependent epimerase/dehydratase family protein [Chloroflexota bacterium]|nr:MAG: NAD-dependent epimerase/dehydratase family protein [Chloroflexota bacterium]
MALKNEYWRDRSVLVTGANGFVGSWVARVLVERGARVVALVRDLPARGGLSLQGLLGRVDTVTGSLTDYSVVERALNEYGVEVCFHLAAQAIVGVANRSPLSTFESNIRGSWNLLEACRVTKTVSRVVVASSDKAYGEHSRLPYDEELELKAAYPYDVSKAATDMLARSYFRTYGLPVAVTRCANIYGGGDLNYSRIVPDTIRALIQGRAPVIRSDGTPVRDYMYVLDTAEAYLCLAEQLDREGVAGEAFNFGTEKPVSVLELVNEIIAVSGRSGIQPQVIGRGKPAGEIDAQYLSSRKARERLGWKPRHNLRSGLRESYLWYCDLMLQQEVASLPQNRTHPVAAKPESELVH